MLTQRELENLIAQVNKSFAEDRKKIKDLEDRIAALEAPAAKKVTKTEEKA